MFGCDVGRNDTSCRSTAAATATVAATAVEAATATVAATAVVAAAVAPSTGGYRGGHTTHLDVDQPIFQSTDRPSASETDRQPDQTTNLATERLRDSDSSTARPTD